MLFLVEQLEYLSVQDRYDQHERGFHDQKRIVKTPCGKLNIPFAGPVQTRNEQIKNDGRRHAQQNLAHQRKTTDRVERHDGPRRDEKIDDLHDDVVGPDRRAAPPGIRSDQKERKIHEQRQREREQHVDNHNSVADRLHAVTGHAFHIGLFCLRPTFRLYGSGKRRCRPGRPALPPRIRAPKASRHLLPPFRHPSFYSLYHEAYII